MSPLLLAAAAAGFSLVVGMWVVVRLGARSDGSGPRAQAGDGRGDTRQ